MFSDWKRQEGLKVSTDGHMPTESYKKGTSEPLMRHVNETLRSLQQLIEGLARVGENLGGFNSPYHQRPFDNVSNNGYHDMMVKNSNPFHEQGYQGRPQVRGGRRGGLGGRGYYRPQEEYPGHEAWQEDNLPKVEDKGRLITNPTRFFSEDLNGSIEKSADDCQEVLLTKRKSSKKELKVLKGNGMVVYLEEAFKIKLKGFEGQEIVSKLFPSVQLAKTKQWNKLEEKLAKCWKAISLLKTAPTADDRLYPTVLIRGDLGKDLDPILQSKEDSYQFSKALKGLWNSLTQFGNSVLTPWLVLEDFNSILSGSDRNDNAHVSSYEVRDFIDDDSTTSVDEVHYEFLVYSSNLLGTGKDMDDFDATVMDFGPKVSPLWAKVLIASGLVFYLYLRQFLIDSHLYSVDSYGVETMPLSLGRPCVKKDFPLLIERIISVIDKIIEAEGSILNAIDCLSSWHLGKSMSTILMRLKWLLKGSRASIGKFN
ncbi:hypothetical protein M9H77_04919 [Catharanthus roseus]|uniref:Uncharacterized protein n=1 Tax=Catharanthus roseus TaxID=4058 RepID=A0ACC0CFG5_CATRO|nr:hypothetical protein M9H77_04919 [Catharanthus roseus]